MPLPHFLALVLTVIAMAGVTLWIGMAVDLPLRSAALVLSLAALVVVLARRRLS